MEWPAIVAIVVAAPLILIPVAFIWYLTIGGAYKAIKEGQKEKATAKGRATKRHLVPHLHRA